MNVLSLESSFHWSFPQFVNVLVAFYGGTEDRTATQNLAQTRKGKKTAGKDFEIFRESA